MWESVGQQWITVGQQKVHVHKNIHGQYPLVIKRIDRWNMHHSRFCLPFRSFKASMQSGFSHDFPMIFPCFSSIAMPHGWGFPGHGAAPLRRGRELSWALPGGSSEYWRYYWTKWGFNRDLMGVIYTYMDYMDYIHIQWGLYTLI